MKDTIYIGIDVSQASNTVHVMDAAGSKIWRQNFENSNEGCQKLISRLLETQNKNHTFMSFGLEATGCYGELLAMFLREDETIPRSQKSVRVLNPKQVSQFKKVGFSLYSYFTIFFTLSIAISNLMHFPIIYFTKRQSSPFPQYYHNALLTFFTSMQY